MRKPPKPYLSKKESAPIDLPLISGNRVRVPEHMSERQVKNL